jgi:hypothetical protein
MCDFIRQVEGPRSQAPVNGDGLIHERDPSTGLLRKRVDTRFADLGAFVTTYDYGPQDVKLFDAPAGMPVTDERDEMHKRGWTYLRIAGEFGGQSVQGVGRLPLVYRRAKTHSPWLRLSVAGKTVAIDDGQRAVIVNQQTGQVTACPGGSLVKSLSSPWIGLHTLDTIRRSAARLRMWFSTEIPEGGSEAQVTVVDRACSPNMMARYAVDLENDVLKRVEFFRAGSEGAFEDRLGELSFSYLVNATDGDPDFAIPAAGEIAAAGQPVEPALFWPVQLMAAPAAKQPG